MITREQIVKHRNIHCDSKNDDDALDEGDGDDDVGCFIMLVPLLYSMF